MQDLKGLLHKTCYDGEVWRVQSRVKAPFQGMGITSHHELCQSDKQIVRSLACLLDDHACSDIFWQELLRTVKGLATLSLINRFRSTIDLRLEITKTPGKDHEAQISFLDEVEYTIKTMATEKNVTLRKLSAQPLIIKLEEEICSD